VTDSLAPETVIPLLRGRFGKPYTYVERCESTQRLLGDDAPVGAVAATDEQTAGRGRLGRDWVAPPRSSVLASVVLQPDVLTASLAELSLVAGRACAQALAEVAEVVPTVKWPNDVLIDGRKVAGILAEAREGRVALGIGINVHQTAEQLPARAEHPATSLLLETGRSIRRAELLVSLLDHLEREHDAWVSGYR
jgi:BirA family biotin operon repressor/biotin-[acetyl-CoA-carboxylase] ligase